ncbi:hypothetical protein AOLI_G00276140 [Acnodon oligacanthus]
MIRRSAVDMNSVCIQYYTNSSLFNLSDNYAAYNIWLFKLEVSLVKTFLHNTLLRKITTIHSSPLYSAAELVVSLLMMRNAFMPYISSLQWETSYSNASTVMSGNSPQWLQSWKKRFQASSGSNISTRTVHRMLHEMGLHG